MMQPHSDETREPDTPSDLPMAPAQRDGKVSDAFVKQFAANRDRLFAYILAFLHDRNASEEVFQETCVILWREFDKFQPDSDFLRWANAISFNRIRDYRRRQRRDRLIFSDDLVEMLATDHSDISDDLTERSEALAYCLEKLRPSDREVLDLFYGTNWTGQRVAEYLGRSIYAIRKVIHRIRRTLFDCVERQLAPGRPE